MTKNMRFGWVEFRKPFVCFVTIRIKHVSIMFSLKGIGIARKGRILIVKWLSPKFVMMKPVS